jgi:transposase
MVITKIKTKDVIAWNKKVSLHMGSFYKYTFGIRSMNQILAEIETNMAYRWFLGYGFHDKVPHFSTFGKNYERRFKDTDLFDQIF